LSAPLVTIIEGEMHVKVIFKILNTVNYVKIRVFYLTYFNLC
jgi:hypothetical protein